MIKTHQHKGTKMAITDNPIKSARRCMQRDPDIAVLIEKASEVKISTTLSDELKQYYVTARDSASGKFSQRGVQARFDNPRKNMEKIAQALLDIQSYRGRVIDIQCLLLDHANTLTSAKRVAVEIIRERYSDRLKQCGSLSLQEVFIDSVIEPLIEKRDYVDLFLKKCDIILKNLDTAYYSFREIAQIGMSVITRSEGGKYSNVKI